MKRIDISYWGYSLTLLKVLVDSEYYRVTCVVTQGGKYSDEFEEICQEAHIPMLIANSKEELIRACDFEHFFNVIVYCFGIIIPREVYTEKTIINIHPGSLETNRGAHALLWSVLIPELGAELAAYKICCPEVDSGELIAFVNEQCGDDDKPAELLKRLERNLPYLIERIYEYLTVDGMKTRLIKGGVYRKRVSSEFYTLNVERDSKSVLKRKINSQSLYDGAILVENGKEMRITEYTDKGTELILIADDGRKRVITFDDREG